MSAERWIEIGACAIIKTEDLIQLPETLESLDAKKANRRVNRGRESGGWWGRHTQSLY